MNKLQQVLLNLFVFHFGVQTLDSEVSDLNVGMNAVQQLHCNNGLNFGPLVQKMIDLEAAVKAGYRSPQEMWLQFAFAHFDDVVLAVPFDGLEQFRQRIGPS